MVPNDNQRACSMQEVQGGMKRKKKVGKIGWMIGNCSRATWVLIWTTMILTWPCV